MGSQHGDPSGPLLFSLPLLHVLRPLRSDFTLGYLDDISQGGSREDVRQDMAFITDLEESLVLNLNRQRCEIYSAKNPTEPEFDGF